MKPSKLFLAGYILLACYSPRLRAQVSPSDSTYILKGKIEGLSDGWIWLWHDGMERGPLDSARVKDGSFVLKGYAADPHFCSLNIPSPTQGKQFLTGFFIQSGELTLSGKKGAIRDAVITGSPVQNEYTQFLAGQKDLDAIDEKLSDLYRAARMKDDRRRMDSVEKASEELEAKRRQLVKEYAKDHPDSYVSTYAIYSNFSYGSNATELGGLYKGMSPAMQTSYLGKKIKEAYDAADLTDIGKPAPAFVQNDAGGKPVSLASFKGQYVLVDFWASWCGPCRAENPNVTKAYHTWHPKGFTILGISLDDNKDKWLAAVKKDQLAWTQVSDLKGWQNSVAELYGVKGIPMNFLLDKDGKIIAKGLRGEDLDKTLADLLK